MSLDVIWIGLGGMVGTMARHLLSTWVLAWTGPAFPWGTFAVNLLGSFLLAVLAQLGTGSVSPTLRAALTTGVMGGFTTYSTFSLETWALVENGHGMMAAANVSLTVVGCLAGTALGLAVGRAAFG